VKKRVEFYFDVGSPAAYLAWTQLPALTARAGAELSWRPMLLGGVFKATDNSSPAAVPAKGAYNRRDLMRYAERYQVPLRFNPHFPVNTLALMRAATACLGTSQLEPYLKAVFEGMWVRQLNMADPQIFAAVLEEAGFEAADLERRANEPATKEALKGTTEDAVSRGVFGAPTFFVDDEMFFGQDRLDWVAARLGTPLDSPRSRES
jgi:2-hydroxychromene-2-carboxylate isomerase